MTLSRKSLIVLGDVVNYNHDDHVAGNHPSLPRPPRGLYPEAKDPESAFRFLQQAAESGHADAHFLIGAMLMAGLGVELSPVRAAQAWAEAASKGHLAALWNLAALQVQVRERG